MSGRRLRGAALLALAALPLPAWAWDTPEQAIDAYLAFELGGGRLQAWPFARYIVAPRGYDEPGWDVLHAVRGWQRGAVRCSAVARCEVVVLFEYADTLALPASWQLMPHPHGGSERLRYTLQRQPAHGWRVAATLGPPRVKMAVVATLWPATAAD
ncbi:hypothetical protein JR065_13395 [Xanthomonas sp. AmX2]|uniref:hypothetical protein n=1 Tax=Xanthomonas sp. TaxID=29446 RepID=UPI00197F2BF7|nr:hypothetical protein [Xanthomonas sp.]MBN6151338.1 hypothetical protein [Xanthomonas sp.]